MQLIPIFLITGFLGSGKTTFINWILKKYADTPISIILNEFGNIKLESQFITSHKGNVVELANGCMCCVAKSDIPRVVEYILKNSPQTQYILIEASGLSDPDPIKEVLAISPLREYVYLHSTLCVIDTQSFLNTYVDHPLVLSQAADADAVIFSKLSLTPPAQVEKVKHVIHTNLSHTPTHDWTDDFDMPMFETGPTPPKKSSSEDEHHHLHEVFEQYWFTTDKPVDIEKLQKAFEMIDTSVYRAKGRATDAQGETYLVQYVAGNLVLEKTTDPSESPQTALLFLGPKLDSSHLNSVFKTVL